MLAAVLLLAGCAPLPRMAPQPDREALPIEAVSEQVRGCRQIGVFVEDVDPARISRSAERLRLEREVRDRARRGGATHLVWLYRYPTGIAARAYRCPAAGDDPDR